MDNQKIFRPDGTYIKVESNILQNKAIGICFSGLHYSYNYPLMYYSRNVLFENKTDYLAIDCSYSENDFFNQMNDNNQLEYIEKDKYLISEYLIGTLIKYEKIILIGKSIGVHFIRTLLKNTILENKVALVLFTPAYEWNDIILEIIDAKYPVLIIGSRNDKMFNVNNLGKLGERTNCFVLEIPNANHSLEVDNITSDLANLSKIIECEKEFIVKYLKETA